MKHFLNVSIYMDTEDNFNLTLDIKEGDDFYNHVNKKWLDNNPIPDDKTKWSTFDILKDNNRKILRDIIENTTINEEGNVHNEELIILKNFYSSSNNNNESDYNLYLNDLVMKIFNSSDKNTLMDNVFDILILNGLECPISYGVEPDLDDSRFNILHVEVGGLGLPDKDYYFNSKKLEIFEEYKKFMKKYLSLFMKISDNNLEKILNIEKSLAEESYTNIEKRDPNNIDNPTTFNNLKSNFNYLFLNKIEDLMKKFGIQNFKGLKINITNPKYIQKFEKIVNDIDIDTLKNYFIWLLLLNVGSYLSEEVVNVKFDFYGKVLSGAENIEERKERVIDLTSFFFGDIISKIYVEKLFPEKSKLRAIELVNNIFKEFKSRLENNEWMTEKTKSKALEKLDMMQVKIGYPEKYKDYSPLYDIILKNNSFLENCLICRNYLVLEDFKESYKKKDLSKWFMNAFDINAYYSPQYNEIVFPAGILQKPFFSDNYEDPLNYGGIGVVIAHEITHGFDDQGRKFDLNGNLNNWYEEIDIANFKKLTTKLEKQFSNYKIGNKNINGTLTLGENIADLGGVTISLNSYKNSRKEDANLKHFFYNYARIWRNNIREEELDKKLQIDPHTPGIWRVNGILPNIDDFYKTFKIDKFSKLYMNTENRVEIW